jgi:hypothetical protein
VFSEAGANPGSIFCGVMSQFKLTVTFPDGAQTPFDLKLPAVTIGRGIQSTVLVPDDSVAESHVELALDVTGYLITSLVADGETLLNGHPLESGVTYQLESGSVIRMGQVEALYESEQRVEEPVRAGGGEPVDFPAPGSFELPKHPAGVFVPRKGQVNAMMVVSLLMAGVAVLGAFWFGFTAANVPMPR